MSSHRVVTRDVDLPPGTLRRLIGAHPERYPVLLDSAARGAHGRWSVLAAFPRYALGLRADGSLHRSAGSVEPLSGSFLATLESWWQAERRLGLVRPAALPFVGGWFVFLGYELASEIEPVLDLPPSRDPWKAFALRIPAALLRDADTGRCVIVAEPGEQALIERISADVTAAARGPIASAPGRLVEAVLEEPEALFLDRVRRIQEAIGAGEIYQANLSRGWSALASVELDPLELYDRLRAANPAPFAAYVSWEGMTLCSSSPERLLQIDGRAQVRTRPIAGTRPRAASHEADAAEVGALIVHPKERAEHVMLVDLERSDLGRVCEAGSVRVEEWMAIESYAHVHHIVSEVSGVLRPSVSPIAALRAVFPGGTITGCPKIRSMQIIAAEEGEGRGAYTGSLGYLGHDGSADFNILIRSISLIGRDLRFRAGAGIVADSDPIAELEETRAKARGLLAALEPRP